MARRVNTKYLTILTIGIDVLVVLPLVGNKFLLQESPEKYINLGNQYIAQKKYDEAAKAFNRAVNLDPKNANVLVAYGDAVNQLSANDPALIFQALPRVESSAGGRSIERSCPGGAGSIDEILVGHGQHPDPCGQLQSLEGHRRQVVCRRPEEFRRGNRPTDRHHPPMAGGH